VVPAIDGMSANGRFPSGERLFIGDGGLETTLIFREGLDLPEFASYVLLRDPAGVEALRRYYGDYLEIARRRGTGFTLDTPTWRANADWGEKLGDSAAALAEVNREAVALAEEIRGAEESAGTPIAICGTIGPRGDAYHPEELMSAEAAERYHRAQIGVFAETSVDMVGAYTLTYAEEAIGIVRAAAANEMPVVISFTLETDGRLPSGQSLGEAINLVDAETDGASAYFMINCAHPSHFAAVIEGGGAWLERLGGIRANASSKSHAELDQATELDAGDPDALGAEYRALKSRLPSARVLGGCCGTDQRHVDSICASWLSWPSDLSR
jgi:S-methylmethionine-dependent homocysteine/selenocysteine methylase